MIRNRSDIGEFLAAPQSRETIRAFVLFGTSLLVLALVIADMFHTELQLRVFTARAHAAEEEAGRIARAVTALGRDRDGIDFSRLRRSREALETVVNERISTRSFVRYVEIRDRFGARLAFVAQDRAPGGAVALELRDGRLPKWPVAHGGEITVPLLTGPSDTAGEIRVGISDEALGAELDRMRRALIRREIAAGVAGLAVLLGGLFYVLYLIRKNRRLEQSRLAAERRSYVGLLASGLAHEIRNPLNAMNMNLQMLEEELHGVPGYETEDHGELLDSTKSEIKRLEGLVSNFLAFARPATPTFVSRDLNDVLQQVCRFLEADFAKSGVALEPQLEPLLPQVEIDETQFKQAVMNLLVNARQVLRSGGKVVIRTRAGSGGEVVLEIEDDGPGMSEETLGRVFEVFFSSRGGGTGLGLPIARQIVERHGGTIEVDSVLDEGTTFRIRLPRHHGGGERIPSREAS